MPLGAFKQTLLGAAGVSTGDIVLLETYTAGGESLKAYTGFSSDYKQLVWQFVNLHGSATDTDLTFRVKTSGGSYGISTQSQAFRSYNRQDGTLYGLAYWPGADVNESTGQVPLNMDVNFTNAEYAVSGSLTLYNPTSSTYYKNWITRGVGTVQSTEDPLQGAFLSGYVLTASALDGIEFKFDSPTANIDTGKILYWGIK
jgi:hypothetical protein